MEISSSQLFCALRLNLEYGDREKKKQTTTIKNNANKLLNFEGLKQLEQLVF